MPITLSHVSYVYEPGTPMEAAGITDISLEIREGEFLGLIGHTGSGKSTLIQHLNGLLRPTSGTVFFNGEDIFAKKYDRRALRGRVGLVFQYPEYQLFESDVLTDVCFGPKNQGLSAQEAKARAEKALATVGVPAEYYSRSPFDLSGGEKRRVAIAGVLAMEPEILILDEPTAGLDPGGREELLTLLRRLKEDGLGVVMVSHSMEDVARYADRIVVMHEGRVLMDGTPREVFGREAELTETGLGVPEMRKLLTALEKGGLRVDKDALTPEEAMRTILSNY